MIILTAVSIKVIKYDMNIVTITTTGLRMQKIRFIFKIEIIPADR